MMALALAVLCSASIALLFKWGEGWSANSLVVTLFNYLGAMVMSGYTLSRTPVTATSSFVGFTIGLGLVTGVFYFLSFIYYQKSIRLSGASLSGMFGKMGILVPMVLSMILWAELPTFIQAVGIFTAMGAILLLSIDVKDLKKFEMKGHLLGLFIIGGLAEFFNKVFQKFGVMDQKPLYLFVVFTGAFIISLFMVLRSRQVSKVRGCDIFLGLLVGQPNLYSAFFLIDALEVIPAAVAFPMYSIMTILVITLMSRLAFKEKLGKKEGLCMLMAMVSLILLQ